MPNHFRGSGLQIHSNPRNELQSDENPRPRCPRSTAKLLFLCSLFTSHSLYFREVA
ncbi:hypothetical protein BN903_209 [Halorubrum sp. AJ67]|nr:hypothetical protein BN903_209 [Halorubrum sp. AJ67]